jgi:hypothetical protein
MNVTTREEEEEDDGCHGRNPHGNLMMMELTVE